MLLLVFLSQVLEPGVVSRPIYLPEGRWRSERGKIYTGSENKYPASFMPYDNKRSQPSTFCLKGFSHQHPALSVAGPMWLRDYKVPIDHLPVFDLVKSS